MRFGGSVAVKPLKDEYNEFSSLSSSSDRNRSASSEDDVGEASNEARATCKSRAAVCRSSSSFSFVMCSHSFSPTADAKASRRGDASASTRNRAPCGA